MSYSDAPWTIETCKVLSELFGIPIRPGKFPGCLPVDVVQEDVPKLSYGYVMSYKADGDRAFLFIQGNHTWLYHRDGHIEWITQSIALENGPLTMFDVEVMTSTKQIYVFDTLMYLSKNLLRTDYLQRLELARKWCSVHQNGQRTETQTNHTVPSRYADTMVELGSFSISTKPVFPTYNLDLLESESVSFAQDGLIFTQLRSSYLPYRTSMVQVLKWKPPSHLTIDVHFTLWDRKTLKYHHKIPSLFYRRNSTPTYLMSIYDDNKKLTPLAGYMGSLPHPFSHSHPIYEVGWKHGSWHILKHRYDKETPNALTTALATLGLIQNPVEYPQLLQHLTPPSRRTTTTETQEKALLDEAIQSGTRKDE